ncbi:MAG TPA: hypothetical protein VKF42_07285 [Chitinivibrionales bacterium]|jgi:hypothetical protein|nr:hypothetical protein [Chitinivibrionales bacterium]
MDTLSKDQIDQLAQDISFVKKAIEKSSSILRQIDFRSSLRLAALLAGISVFAFCGLFYFLIGHFGGFAAIPASVKAVAFCAAALDLSVLGILKNMGVLKSARAFDPGISLFRLIREYYSERVYHHFIPVGGVFVFSAIYAAATGNSRFLIPILSIGAGLICNNFDAWLRIDEFLFTGYWFIIAGCILMAFNSVSPLLGLCLTLGCGLLLLAGIWYLPQKKRTEA